MEFGWEYLCFSVFPCVLRICKVFYCSLGAYLLSPGYLSSVLCCVVYIELRIPIVCVVCRCIMDGWVGG